jgi:hypothetical protein
MLARLYFYINFGQYFTAGSIEKGRPSLPPMEYAGISEG